MTAAPSDSIWRRATWLVVSLVVIGAGWIVSYLQNGDAVELRSKVRQQNSRIEELEKERELMSKRLPRCRRDYDFETCRKLLDELNIPRAAGPSESP